MEDRYRESNRVTVLSIIINIVLTILKIVAGIIGNSTAIIADGLHSASDILTSVGIIIGNVISNKPSDNEHQYGHEKAESIVSFVLALALILVALKIGMNGVESLLNLDKLSVPTFLPLIVSVISIVLKEYQYQITIRVAKRINSSALKADAWHHRSDALSSIAAFVGIGGAMLGIKILDPIASIGVALVVIKVGINIFKSACSELMDSSMDKEDIEAIKNIINAYEKVHGIGIVKSRKYGAVAYIDLTILIDKSETLEGAHDIADKIEAEIIEEYKYIKEVNIHTEPYIE